MNKMIWLGAGVVLAAALTLAMRDHAQVVTTLDTTKLTYSQDALTNLCFATVGRGESALGVRAASLSFTHVPCTPQVLAVIRKG